MKAIREYPRPDDDRPNMNPRFRAMAVLKLLLDLEPEEAIKHDDFDVIVRGFEMERKGGYDLGYEEALQHQS